MSPDLQGAAVLVSGSAVGIGRAVSEAFSARGSRLALVDVDETGLQSLVTELGPDVEAVQVVADVTEETGAAGAVERAVAQLGRVDVLVNVVGGSRPGKDVVEMSPADWDDMLRFNLTSMFLMCHFAIPYIAAAGGGSVVNISSGAGLRGMRKNPGYCAAKAGVVGFTKALAADHGSQGIRVNAIAPGPVLTPLMRRNRSADEIATMGGLTIVGRVADPSEIAAAVVFLAGNESSYMTGQTLEVDGGPRSP